MKILIDEQHHIVFVSDDVPWEIVNTDFISENLLNENFIYIPRGENISATINVEGEDD